MVTRFPSRFQEISPTDKDFRHTVRSKVSTNVQSVNSPFSQSTPMFPFTVWRAGFELSITNKWATRFNTRLVLIFLILVLPHQFRERAVLARILVWSTVTQSAHTYGTLLGVIWEKLWDPYGLPSEGPLGG